MLEHTEYIQSDIPPLTSPKMDDYAEALEAEYKYFDDSSQELRQQIWPACGDAYMCKRVLPQADGMDWADTSDMGETDIKDGVDFMSEAITLAALQRDNSAFQVVSEEETDQSTLNDTRDLLAWLARNCDFRGQYQKHAKQMMIYGTSPLWVRWKKDIEWVKLGRASTIKRMKDLGRELGEDTSVLDKIRFPQVVYNGPVVQPISMYDFYLDPAADIATDRDVAKVIRIYKTPEELKRAKDEYGQPAYDLKVLEDVEPWTPEEIRNDQPFRFQAIETLGLNTLSGSDASVKYIPILIFHRPVRVFDNDVFVDTYFYVAISAGGKPKVIRIQENYGGKCIFIDTYTDWVANTAYGIGAVEKSLQAYHQKNVLSALTLNAQLASVFPAYSVITDVLLSDRGLKIGPGAITPVKYKPSLGLNYIAPIPGPEKGVQLGMLDQQFLGQKILGQMGAYGAIMQDPTKTPETEKTATQINTESTTGSITRDNLLETLTIRSLEPALQYILEQAKEHLEDNITFARASSSGVSMGRLTKDALLKATRVIVTYGFHANMNKQQEISELREALAVFFQSEILQLIPSLTPAMQETIFRLLGLLGVRNLEKYKQDPAAILAENPVIRQQIEQRFAEAHEMGRQLGHQEALSGAPPEGVSAPEDIPMQSPDGAQELLAGGSNAA